MKIIIALFLGMTSAIQIKKEWYEEAWVDPCDASYTEGSMSG